MLYLSRLQHTPAGGGESGVDAASDEGVGSAMSAWDWVMKGIGLVSGVEEIFALALAIMIYVGGRRAKRKRGASTSSRRVSRPYLVEPLRTNDPRVGECLVEMVRGGAGVPLVCSQRKNGLWNLLRWTRLYCVLHDTTPSCVFEVVEWRHIPTPYLDSDVVYTWSASSVLFFRLADGERREHFKHSINIGLSGSRRPIVLAKVEDLCDPTAWVRRIYVNAVATGEDHQTRSGVSFPSSASMEVGATATSRIRQKDAPPGAIWLVCDNEEQAPPSPDWGDKPDSSNATPRPDGPLALEHHLKKQHKWWWTQKSMMLLIFGLVPAGFTLYGSSVEEPGNVQMGLGAFSAVWFIATGAVAIVWMWAELRGRRLKHKWKKKEGAKGEWTGGTARGVYLGRLIKDISFQDGKGLRDLWERTWP